MPIARRTVSIGPGSMSARDLDRAAEGSQLDLQRPREPRTPCLAGCVAPRADRERAHARPMPLEPPVSSSLVPASAGKSRTTGRASRNAARIREGCCCVLGIRSRVPNPDSRNERLRTAARWPFGIVLTSYRYLWRLTPIDRWEWPGALPHDAPPALPDGIDRTDLQTPEDGVGPLVRRLYRVRIRGSSHSPEELVRTLTRDLDAVAPSEFASFQKRSGDDGAMHVNDDYVVRMPGPWDGPVRVVACSSTSFRLATLRGHLEAGQIEFRACNSDGSLEFTIESWARSGDRLSDLMYTHLRVSKEVQLHMWTSVLERVVECSEGRRHGPMAILTRRVDFDTDGTSSEPILHGPRNPRARQRLAALAGRSLNFDIDADRAVAQGWHVDEVARDLPIEPSGPPVPGGSWETARRLMISYEVADPDIVRATYREDVPLRGRDMLLETRLAGFIRLRAGVRIGGDYDETRVIDGREVRVFGWDYATLEGHFQSGRVRYEVWKWLDTGTVEFRLRAYSRTARSGPLVSRLGYRLLGRSRQLSYYRRAARRVAGLTNTQLELARDAWCDPADAVPMPDLRPSAAGDMDVREAS